MIELQDITLRYGTREILDNVSLTIEDNKIKAVLGPSGVGKSTILKLVLGLIKPNCGKILIRRFGYQIIENKIKNSACTYCGAEIDGVIT